MDEVGDVFSAINSTIDELRLKQKRLFEDMSIRMEKLESDISGVPVPRKVAAGESTQRHSLSLGFQHQKIMKNLRKLQRSGQAASGGGPQEFSLYAFFFQTVRYPDTTVRLCLHLFLLLTAAFEFAEVTAMWARCDPATPSKEGLFLGVWVATFLAWSWEMALSFFTPFFRDWELIDGIAQIKIMRRRYLRTWFAFDVLVTFPFDILALLTVDRGYTFNYLQCAKPFSGTMYSAVHWIRALRVVHFVSFFRASDPLRARFLIVKIARTAFILFFATHSLAVIWLLMSDDHERLAAPGTSTFEHYVGAFLWAVQTSAHGQYITPKKNSTRILTLSVSVCGFLVIVVLTAITVAYLVTTDPFHRAANFRKDRLSRLMKENGVPWETQKNVHAVYPSLLTLGNRDYAEILGQLPDFIAEEIRKHMRITMIGSVPLFHGLSPIALEGLSITCFPLSVSPRVILQQKGEDLSSMYFLVHGIVEVYYCNDDEENKTEWRRTLKDGSWFGEQIILYGSASKELRISTVTECEFFTLSKDACNEVGNLFPEVRIHLENKARSRKSQRKNDIKRGSTFGIGGGDGVRRKSLAPMSEGLSENEL